MKTVRYICLITALSWTSLTLAGDPKDIVIEPEPVPDIYEGGRGLITLQGPTGMFINPTSGTMEAGHFTAQYCMFSPFVDTSVVGHGWLAAYAVTDWFELAALASYVDNSVDPAAAGPQARIRLLQNEGLIPQVSLGYYGRYGDAALQNTNIYAAAYNRVPIDEAGIVKAIGLHYGIRNSWAEATSGSELVGYGGAELQLPLRMYLVGEISTDDTGDKIPFSYGVQWRAGLINLSVAMVQPGGIPGGPGFYVGIGSQFSF